MSLNHAKVIKRYSDRYSGRPLVYRAPARVNIIGEHTDYNDGLVLPTTTALYTWVAIAPRDDRQLHVYSRYADEAIAIDLDRIEGSVTAKWSDYVKGVVLGLLRDGVELKGADVYIDGDVPVGGGLSSSASLTVATAVALLGNSAATMERKRIAQICQQAETETVGLQCGIMDQYSVAACRHDTAMLIDCRTLDVEYIPIGASIRLLVVDTGVKHKLIDDGYNNRAEECQEALQILQAENSALHSLCDLTQSELLRCAEHLGDTLYRRCRHVVSENERVARAVVALRNSDKKTLGSLMSESHESLRDDYEVSCDEANALVDVLVKCRGVHGARLIGAGFGGCVLALVEPTNVSGVIDRVAAAQRESGGSPTWYHLVEPTEPAMFVTDESDKTVDATATG